MKRGYTLLELMVVVAIIALVAIAAAGAYQVGIAYPSRLASARQDFAQITQFEDRITALLRNARLSSDAANPSSFFIGAPGLGENAQLGSVATTIAFTTAGARVQSELLDTDESFEALNERFGPVGGPQEVQVGTSPVGDAGGREGLFLRLQQPADGDPTQGGFEQLLSARVRSMTFEFWDGTAWLPEWDTRTLNPPRLPAAVRLTYRWDQEETDRTLIVRLALSDVTPENPVATEAGG